MTHLTRAQASLYEHLSQRTNPWMPIGPTEVAEMLNVSRTCAFEHLRALVHKGVVETIPLTDRPTYHTYRLKGMPLDRLLSAAREAARVCEVAGEKDLASRLQVAIRDLYPQQAGG